MSLLRVATSNLGGCVHTRFCGVFTTHPGWSSPVCFLATLYDHKPWPDHPRDPAGYCQIGHDTAVIVGSLTACIQSRNRLLFRRPVAGEPGRPGSSFPSENSWRFGIGSLIKEWMLWGGGRWGGGPDLSSSCPGVCVHLFGFSAHGPVWSQVQSRGQDSPPPEPFLPPSSFKARWKCRCVIPPNSQDVT